MHGTRGLFNDNANEYTTGCGMARTGATEGNDFLEKPVMRHKPGQPHSRDITRTLVLAPSQRGPRRSLRDPRRA